MAKVFKVAGEFLPLVSTITDVGFTLLSIAKGEDSSIPFVPPFIFEEALKQRADTDELVYSGFIANINSVISKMKDVESFISRWESSVRKRYLYDWALVRVSADTIQKIINKEITRIKNEDINKIRLSTPPSDTDGGILIFINKKDKDKYDQDAVKIYIYAIYLPEIIITT